ncbi:hypothetical protein ACP26L_36545 (plasmid) [Paenibacillus sp. S-38]|uniref:hypothetical protein n=1 Tax=Paenibacillus sp. S-38 TaxID=3416710 RepID=UPI003CED78E9
MEVTTVDKLFWSNLNTEDLLDHYTEFARMAVSEKEARKGGAAAEVYEGFCEARAELLRRLSQAEAANEE